MKNRSISYIHLIWIHSFSHIACQCFFKQISSVPGVFIRFIKTAFLSVCFYLVMNEDRNNVWKWASAAVIKSEYIYHNWSLWSVSEAVINVDRTRSSMRTVTGGGKKPLCVDSDGTSLAQTFTGSIMPRLTSNIFCRLAAQSDPFWVG